MLTYPLDYLTPRLIWSEHYRQRKNFWLDFTHKSNWSKYKEDVFEASELPVKLQTVVLSYKSSALYFLEGVLGTHCSHYLVYVYLLCAFLLTSLSFFSTFLQAHNAICLAKTAYISTISLLILYLVKTIVLHLMHVGYLWFTFLKQSIT